MVILQLSSRLSLALRWQHSKAGTERTSHLLRCRHSFIPARREEQAGVELQICSLRGCITTQTGYSGGDQTHQRLKI
ncbi:uncharacterized protein LOC119562584 isoform X2 [Drosophila subpulchrella]|uniref:uncharacterized protein LOC119562584 isoform X2 n=1 Tax=Drosophila subpulchrella TaxID=1486046 RepID=UPI0018A1A314|nr:uncharacterized protein LOC119562584 isoform X2 [Drosophila subpulchrella]